MKLSYIMHEVSEARIKDGSAGQLCGLPSYNGCDNARPHLGKAVTDLLSKYKWKVLPHAPCSPDMSLLDFDLFPKLKEIMRGHCFSSLEEVSAAVTRAIRGLNKSRTLNGIANLSKRWDTVIEKQGDYIVRL
jgi:hypothetical protein